MTLTIELPPDIEAELLTQAKAQGVALPQFVEYLLREHVPARGDAALSPLERAARWRESVKNLPHSPPLSDEAISRESIYGNCG